MYRTLLRAHLRGARNRLLHGPRPWLAVAALLAAAGGAGALLVLTGHALYGDLPTLSVGDRIFWVNAALLFVVGLTTFEVLFRDRAARRLETLPIPAATWFAERFTISTLRHLPLLLAVLLLAAPLLTQTPALFFHALFLHGTSWLLGVCAGTWLHTLAGRSILTGPSKLKTYFGQYYHTEEATLTLYSPAGTFAIGVFSSLILERIGFDMAEGRPNMAPAALGAVVVVCAAALRKTRQVFLADWSLIRARFREAEFLRPWREGEPPRWIPGAWVLRWTPAALRTLVRKDLVQQRRRHRFDPLTIGTFAVVVVWGNLRADAADAGLFLWDAAAAVIGAGLVLNPVFKLAGRELEPSTFLQALPLSLTQARRAKLLAALGAQAPLVLGATLAWVAGVIAAPGTPALSLLAAPALFLGGLAAAVGLSSLFLAIGLRRRPCPGWLPWLYRAAGSAAVATTAALVHALLAPGGVA